MRVAFRITQNWYDAEEAVSTAVLKIIQMPNEPDNLDAYFLVVARNAALDIVRRRKSQYGFIDEIAEDECYTDGCPCGWLIREEAKAILHSSMRKLTSTDRTVLCMHYIEGKSYPEIAKSLRITEAAVTSRLHKARARLKKELLFSGLDE